MNRRYIVTNHFYPEHTHISHFVMGTVTKGEIKISVGEIVFIALKENSLLLHQTHVIQLNLIIFLKIVSGLFRNCNP